MWYVYECRDVETVYATMPSAARETYEVWKSVVQLSGPVGLRQFTAFRDGKLQGERSGQRSSRLSGKFTVVYEVEKDIVTVSVEESAPRED